MDETRKEIDDTERRLAKRTNIQHTMQELTREMDQATIGNEDEHGDEHGSTGEENRPSRYRRYRSRSMEELSSSRKNMRTELEGTR